MTLPGRPSYVALAFAAAACGACGDDGPTVVDAAVDASQDPCAPDLTFTGEYIDWDSTQATFAGIFGAKLTHRGAGTTSTTAPNGRFQMCVPDADGLVDVVPMAGSDYVAGTVVILRASLATQPTQSYRSFTTARAASFGFAATHAHVFVHVDGAARTLATGTAAGVTHAFDGAAWVAGATGTDVYLGNLDPQGGTTTLTADGAQVATIPLVAGAFTYLTIR